VVAPPALGLAALFALINADKKEFAANERERRESYFV
jgi:hypothetical protein